LHALLSLVEKRVSRKEYEFQTGEQMNKLLESVDQREKAAAHDLTVADAVWVGTALLQMQYPDAPGFTTEEIVERVRGLHLTQGGQKSIWQHVNQHCVANRKPQPNRSRMLYALGQGNRRLFRDGDRSDPGREGAPTHPQWDRLPAEYGHLERWYEEWNHPARSAENDPLLKLVGSGVEIWNGAHADDYVASLRQGWEGR
jgi:hypothetical protein